MKTVMISPFEAVRRAWTAEVHMREQRDALLQALINLLDNIHDTERDDGIVQAVEQARAAIAATKEGE